MEPIVSNPPVATIYRSLAFCTTVVCLGARSLPALAEAMQEAAETIERSMGPTNGPSPEEGCPARGARMQVFSGPRVEPQQMHNLN